MSMEMFLMRSHYLDCAPCICHCRSKIDALVMSLFTPSLFWKTGDEILAYPSQDSSQYEWRKRRTNTECTLAEVESGSMITPMWTRKQHNWYQLLLVSHTYTSKSLWWSLVRMVAQNLMQQYVSFNNVGKDSQDCNATSRPSNIMYTETHTKR